MLAIFTRLRPQKRKLIDLVLEEIDEFSFWLEYITDKQIMKKKVITPLFD
jgi:hypothetical protein